MNSEKCGPFCNPSMENQGARENSECGRRGPKEQDAKQAELAGMKFSQNFA